MKGYGHLTFEERECIALLHAEGLCPSVIGRAIGRPACTVGRDGHVFKEDFLGLDNLSAAATA